MINDVETDEALEFLDEHREILQKLIKKYGLNDVLKTLCDLCEYKYNSDTE